MIRRSFASFRYRNPFTSVLVTICAFLLFVSVVQYPWISGNRNYNGQVRENFILRSSPLSPLPANKPAKTPIRKVKRGKIHKRCQPLALEAFNSDVLKYYGKTFVDCGKEYNRNSSFSGVAFTVKNGNQLHRLVNMGLRCCFKSFFRDGDDYVSHKEKCHRIRNNVTIIPSYMKFIKVLCRQNRTLMYRDAFPIAHANIKRKSRKESGFHLNVAIVGLDSTSRLNFLRQMPLSSNYLLEKMDAISLQGYSIVGQGTLKNFLPMLTGLSFAEFYRVCAQDPFLDNCPFIWHEFSKRGYITNYADDWSMLNEYFPNAFNNSPTDYYFRPYLVHMAKFHPALNPAHYCLGPRLAFEVILNFMQQVRQKAETVKRPYFQFTNTGRLAHDYMNHLGLGDVPLLLHLMELKDSGALNNTVLMVLGDHGFMQGYYFLTESGKLEYRLPAAYIVLPPWFKNRFPEKFENLQGNVKRMTTPYNIHETLLELMELGHNRKLNGKGHRGISLFENIPESRKCVEAGISLKWCKLCHSTINLDFSEPIVGTTSKIIVNSVNSWTKHYTNLCANQTLGQVKQAYKWHSKDVHNEVCNTLGEIDVGMDEADYSTKQLNISCGGNDLVEIINLQLVMLPFGNIYQGEVLLITKRNDKYRHSRIKRFMLTDSVVRIDRYEKSGHCVPKSIKPYCMCVQNQTSIKSGKA